jgi:hypothetical protein
MTVFISHAGADQAAAEALEGVLERRGHFVERDDGEVALAPVEPHDVVIALISRAFAADANKLRLTQRALDAWSAGKLVLVRLDETPAPTGLRDWPIADASVAETRDLAWVDVASAIQKLGGGVAPVSLAPARQRRGGGVVGVLISLLLVAPGLFVIAASASIWLANRIGPTPGGWPELLAGIDSFGRYYGLPPGVTPVLFGAAVLVLLGVLARLALKIFGARKPRIRAARKGGGVYVSAAPEDSARANALVASAREGGAAVEIAASVEQADAILVMCSPAAYQSDRVKRDLFLAERSGKRVTPVFLDAAPPPEDFAYFFAPDSGVALHQAPEGERVRLLAHALGAPAVPSVASATAEETQTGSPAGGA